MKPRMGPGDPFRRLTASQRHVFVASVAGWALDAFDFFLFVFALPAIAQEFRVEHKDVAEGIFLTLAMRPFGSLFFGWLAERYGRRPVLMINIVSYSVCELASAFAPDLATLLVLRALFGFAMGGEWGIGAALALESLPAQGRGLFSGILQEGYVIGYLLAGALFAVGFETLGWRGMFVVGAAPALLVLYIRATVDESPAWLAGRQGRRPGMRDAVGAVRAQWRPFAFMVLLMTFFAAFSHGSQDLYPTFLQTQHGFGARTTGTIAVVYNVGALCGGICFGALSERLGRRRSIALAALLALPVIPWWAYAATPLGFAVGAFVMQFMVQGAWGIVPAHLNELSPPTVRAVLPGFAYQLGNLLTSRIAPIQAEIAASRGGDLAEPLAWTVAVVGVALAVLVWLGGEAKNVELD